MWDAAPLASLTTAAGTLVLAVATFSATRSANQSSRIAEQSLLAAMRPVLMPAQIGDPVQKVGFGDDHWVRLEGPGASAELDEATGVIYLAIALRNVGSGIGVLQGWHPAPNRVMDEPHPPLEEFRRQSRDLYVPPGGIGFWQGAFRDPEDPLVEDFAKAVNARQAVTVHLLYTDLYGGQQTITRFSVIPFPSHDSDSDEVKWMGAASRHWVLDGHGPR